MDHELIHLGRSTIQQEASALQGFVDSIDGSFVKACEIIFQCQGTVLVTGIGKSGLVAMIAFSELIDSWTFPTCS